MLACQSITRISVSARIWNIPYMHASFVIQVVVSLTHSSFVSILNFVHISIIFSIFTQMDGFRLESMTNMMTSMFTLYEFIYRNVFLTQNYSNRVMRKNNINALYIRLVFTRPALYHVNMKYHWYSFSLNVLLIKC